MDDLPLLLAVVPSRISHFLEKQKDLRDLVEIVMDLGRLPEARFFHRAIHLNGLEVTRDDLDYATDRIGPFTADNRSGIERTLHRISGIRNRRGEIIGLTCRVGRALTGTVEVIRDVIETGESLLLLGAPGVGKTTLLREAARVLADDLDKRVVVVDTSNEIAGDGDVPHPGIGQARRMQVLSPELQHRVMIEAVENHMPEVIVIDEIGTVEEALAARTIAERGVQLIATAHGITLDNLIINPTLSDLLGGIQAVTLSDEEAQRRGSQKTVLERKARPTFDNLVEIQRRDRLAIYRNVAMLVDQYLTSIPFRPEIRIRGIDGKVQIQKTQVDEELTTLSVGGVEKPNSDRSSAGIYLMGISYSRTAKAIKELKIPVFIVKHPSHADLILSLKTRQKRHSKSLQKALDTGIEFYTLKSNTLTQIRNFLRVHFASFLGQKGLSKSSSFSMGQAEDAVVRVQRSLNSVELSPQSAYIRRLQHELVRTHGLRSESRGVEPFRQVIVYPEEF